MTLSNLPKSSSSTKPRTKFALRKEQPQISDQLIWESALPPPPCWCANIDGAMP